MAQRNRALDVLRGIAIAMVLVHHLPVEPGKVLTFVQSITWAGVDLFFVLSGFLVSGLLFREYRQSSEVDAGRFLIRRGFKIYPAYYSLLLATFFVRAFFSSVPLQADQVLSQIFFLQNYGPRIWGHTWSLAVEEHFYLLLCLLVHVLARKGKMRFVPCIALAVLPSVAFLRFMAHNPMEGPEAFFPTHLRIDGLFFGVLLSYLYHFHRDETARFMSWKWHPALASVFGAITWWVLVTTPPLPRYVFGLSMLYIFFGYALMVSVFRKPSAPSLPERFLSGIGVYSYSIYLWHEPLRVWLSRANAHFLKIHNPYLECGVYLAISLVAGFLLSKLIELPFLRVRDRLAPSKAPEGGFSTDRLAGASRTIK